MKAAVVADIGRLPCRDWQTVLMYRSLEKIWHSPKVIVGAMDMWVFGVVVTAVCGSPFTDFDDKASLHSAWVGYLGNRQTNAGFTSHLPQSDGTTPKKE